MQLLSKPKFSCIEKIKTIGSSYMVAAGLNPGHKAKKEVMVRVRFRVRVRMKSG